MAKNANITDRCNELLTEATTYIAKNSVKQAAILLDEFDRVVEIIETLPGIGVPYKNGIRYLGLGKFRYNLYYIENEIDVDVLGIWHTSRGTEFKP